MAASELSFTRCGEGLDKNGYMYIDRVGGFCDIFKLYVGPNLNMSTRATTLTIIITLISNADSHNSILCCFS